MIKILRPYQVEVITKLRQRLKEVTHPLLINASVGAGKSLILSELLMDMERTNYRALCLTMNSTLIEQNAETHRVQGGKPGIYCSALDSKDTRESVIFASPHSVAKGISNIKEISKIEFNLIIVDECHNVNYDDKNTMYMRILNHYGNMAQKRRYSFRIVGLTGTPYRGKGISIVGDTQFFKEEICNINTPWLVSNGYLAPVLFGHTIADSYDYSNLRVNCMGKFNQSEIQAVVNKNERLTAAIMRDVIKIVSNNHQGAFIFAATRKHCEECSHALPEDEWAIITGETAHEKRKEILEKARGGKIKYLISVNCLNVGVDVPRFDVAAWLRPTESLILYTQGIGRVLRLHPDKSSAIVLDYAGNLQRHGDIDDPIINAALQPTEENEQEYVIPCYTCGTNNTVHARRCIGIVSDKRCEYFFQFKDCHKCGIKNDITSRYCRECETELIDPNKKLKLGKSQLYSFAVKRAKFWVGQHTTVGYPIINCEYIAHGQTKSIFECFHIKDEKTKNIAYAKFVRIHIKEPSKFYMDLMKYETVLLMITKDNLIPPTDIHCTIDEYDRYTVMKKSFDRVEALYL